MPFLSKLLDRAGASNVLSIRRGTEPLSRENEMKYNIYSASSSAKEGPGAENMASVI